MLENHLRGAPVVHRQREGDQDLGHVEADRVGRDDQPLRGRGDETAPDVGVKIAPETGTVF